jgi:hypothetical protein
MRVEEGGPGTQFGPDCPEGARVESGTPRHLVGRHAVGTEPPGQLGARTGDDDLSRTTGTGELPGKQPDLTLSTPPFPCRGDVNDSRRQAGRPPSRAISPRSRRSSARLNGLWR